MKNLSCLLVCFALAIQSFSQTAAQPRQVSQEQIDLWNKKAKTNLTVAVSMFAVGSFMIAGGAIAYANGSGWGAATSGQTAAVFGGALIDLASIPFFVMWGVNRKKAKNASVSMSVRSVPLAPIRGNMHLQSQPALTLSIPLGR